MRVLIPRAYQLFSSVGKSRGAATSDHVKNIVATTEGIQEIISLRTRARGGAIDCKTIDLSEEGVADAGDRARSTRLSKRQDPPSRNRKGSRTTRTSIRSPQDRRDDQENKRPHVERVTPAVYARRKFAPPYWTTTRGALTLPIAMRPPSEVNERRPLGPWPTMQLPDKQQVAGWEGGMEKNRNQIGFG